MKYNLNNKGVATVEASLIMPIFIFSMLAIYHMAQAKLAENVIYDAGVETAEYLAEIAYLNKDSIYGARLVFHKYVDDEDLLKKYIKGGVQGVDFLGTTGIDSEGYYELRMNYEVVLSLPFVPELSSDKTVSIRCRAYVGDDVGEDESGDNDRYVFVTENREVYHESRLCTYLELSISTTSAQEAKSNGLLPCEYCGDGTGEMVIVTNYGEKYHYSFDCSGLKRTIFRVKFSEVEGIGGCTRCTN